ncbi:hypothetical protein [Janthinobacterium agaricidamnosum]|uniref:hypothetical protein n=1 Tax=Janthinobacterium agaricidamnosum TaxID=55508 RepID=UPI000AD8DD73|nr:hypothetical protein [Janthinobacterium agaricidamnosum]
MSISSISTFTAAVPGPAAHSSGAAAAAAAAPPSGSSDIKDPLQELSSKLEMFLKINKKKHEAQADPGATTPPYNPWQV